MHQLNPWLLTSYAVAAVIELVAPLALAVFLARRRGGRWKFWAIGLGVFAVFQVATRIPAMAVLQLLPAVQEWLKQPAAFWLFIAFAAFTAGLFEEGGRWLALRYVVRPEDRTRNTALMMGAGHGGLESMGVGLLVALAAVNYVVLTIGPVESLAPPQALEAARVQFAQLQGWEPLLGGWERLCTLLIHMALSVMVLWSFTRSARWWWYALAAHTVTDFCAVGLLRVASTRWSATAGMLLTEGLVSLLGLAALAFIIRSRDGGRVEPIETAPAEKTDAV